MLSEVLGAASKIAPIVKGDPSTMVSRAESSAYGETSASNKISFGDFNLGGTKTTSTLFWVVGIVALIFLMSRYFKK